jgi:acetylornithine deacetylase
MTAPMELSKEQIARAIRSRREWAVGALSDFVRQPSVLGNEEGAQKYAEQLFREVGYEAREEVVRVDDIKDKPGFSPVDWPLDGKVNVAGVHEPANTQGRSLIFNGHVDVVSPEPSKLWSSPPFEPRFAGNEEDGDDWLYGRGAGDMKGGTICYLWALHALRDLGAVPASKVILQSVVEEECTGNGALAMLEKGYTADAAVIPEPFNETITRAQVGVLWFRVRVLGTAGHVLGAQPGVNAIEKSWVIIQALRELEAEVNREANIPPLFKDVPHPINLNVGTIRGGDWQSSIAGECVTGFRFGAFPGENLAGVKQLIEDRVANAAQGDSFLQENPPQLEWAGFQAEGCEFDIECDFAKSLRRAHHDWRGSDPLEASSTATTDIRFFNLYYGIPATCYGPKAMRIHGVDEKVSINSMQNVAEVLCSFIQDWCKLQKPS